MIASNARELYLAKKISIAFSKETACKNICNALEFNVRLSRLKDIWDNDR